MWFFAALTQIKSAPSNFQTKPRRRRRDRRAFRQAKGAGKKPKRPPTEAAEMLLL
jgi:hypothetical protein